MQIPFKGAGAFCLMLMAIFFSMAARGGAPAQVDTTRRDTVPSLHQGRPDTLKEVRILGQNTLMEKKLDRTVVHIDALIANAGVQAWNVLENTPGVTVDDDGSISLNGKQGVLILVDDRPLYLEGQALVSFLKGLPASGLEQVELLPTPPARYPASGGAGIIILRTRKAASNGFQTQLTSNYTQGMYPKLSQSVQVSGQEGPWQFRGFASYNYSRMYFNSDRYRHYLNPDGTVAAAVTQDFHEDSWQQSINYSAEVEHRGKGPTKGPYTSWGLEVSGDAIPYHEFGHYLDGYYEGTTQLDSSGEVHSNFHNTYVDIFGNAHIVRTMKHPGRTLSADFDVIHHQLHQQQVENTTTSYPDTSLTNLYELITVNPATARIYSLKADYTDRFGEAFYLEAGAQATHSLLQNAGSYQTGTPADVMPDSGLDNTFQYTEDIRSAYLTLRKTGKKFTAQGGLRMENTLGDGRSQGNLDSSIHLSYTNLFPSAHLQWDVNGDSRDLVSFSYARRIDRPGFGELNPAPFFFDRNTYFSGNPALQPEFSQNLELSFTYLNRFTLTASYSVVHGSINQVFTTEGRNFYYYFINMDRAITAGLSADVNTPLTAHWTFNYHVEWMYKHYNSALPGNEYLDKTLPYILMSGNTRYSFSKGWSAELGGFYKSDVLLAQSTLRPVGRLNLGVRKKINPRASLALEGNDVLRTWIVSRNIDMQDAVAYFRNSFDRRTVSLTFVYSFGKKDVKVAEHTSGIEQQRSRL